MSSYQVIALALAMAGCSSRSPLPSEPRRTTPERARDAATGAELAEACRGLDGYADPAPPTRIFGNTWFVGTCGITVLLVTSDQGHVLIDGGPVEAAPLVAANVERLGFELKDVRWILSSHEHDDHAGGLAELARLTGAKVAALETSAPQLAAGRLRDDDPQHAIAKSFPPVAVDRVLRDRDEVRLGPLVLSARSTPAHSAGSTSWAWKSCDADRCRTIAYADSATVISADGFRFSDDAERIRVIRDGLARIGELPCEVLVTPHPGASNLFARLAGGAPLVGAEACRAYAQAANERFTARLTKEAAEP